jgi:hypothetical protein
MMTSKWKVVLYVLIPAAMLVLFGLLACSAPALPALGKTAMPTSTATPVPTATSLPTPTPTATPEPVPSVAGSLVNYETGDPLAGALVTLCVVADNGSQCTIDQSLVAYTDEKGFFVIPVEAGEYAILYSASGRSRASLAGFELDYREPTGLAAINTTVVQVLLLSISNGRSIPAEDIGGCYQTFLGPDGARFSAYLLYRPYDLGMVMYNNKLVSVTVEDGPAEINLAVWDHQGDDPSCEDFNPYR